MSGIKSTWTKQNLARLRKSLAKNTSIFAVASDLGQDVTSIRNACSRYLGKPPTALLKKEPKAETLDSALDANRAKSEETRTKRLLREALKRVDDLRATVDRLSAPEPRPAFSIVRQLGSNKRQAWGLSVMSDIHAGATVVPSASVCWNAYNPEICRQRLDRYFESIPWLINDEHSFDIQGHCLAAIGDLIDGHLHDDQTETSEAPLVTVNWLEPFLWGRFEALATELGPHRELRILWTPGNHGRDTLKPRAATYCEHSHEWAMGQRLARHFAKHKTIRVIAPPARDVYTEIYGRVLHGTHGDTVNYQGGMGGITIPLRKAYATWQMIQPAYLHITGHFHTQLDLGDDLANGSGIGYTDFARKCNARPEVAQQTFCLLDSERGKTKVSPIWMTSLSDREKLALADAHKLWESRNA
jgi:hypothetical protein